MYHIPTPHFKNGWPLRRLSFAGSAYFTDWYDAARYNYRDSGAGVINGGCTGFMAGVIA